MRRWPWLEIFLAVAALALAVQIYPRGVKVFLRALDVSRWGATERIAANVILVALLIGVRFKSEITSSTRRLYSKFISKRLRRGSTGAANSGRDEDYQERYKRDAEWRERARKRMPFR